METSLTAPFHGRVRAVLAGTNVHVAAQAPLVALEPLDGGPPPAAGERISFAPTAPTAPTAQERLAAPRVARARLRRRRTRGRADRRRLRRRPGAASPASTVCLRMFADVHAAVPPAPRRGRPGDPVAAQPAGASQCLAGLARSRDGRVARSRSWRNCAPRSLTMGSPASTAPRHWRRRAIASTSPRSAPRRRARPSCRSSSAGSTRSLRWPEQRARTSGEALDHLILTMEGRDPVVADLAREVRYHYFDEPVIVAAREGVYTEMEAHVAALAERLRSGPTAASASRRSSIAHSHSRRCSARACARPHRRSGASSSRQWRAAITGCARSRPSRPRPSATTSC